MGGVSQCKQVLFLTLDYVEIDVSLDARKSQTGLLIWDGGSFSQPFSDFAIKRA